MTAAAAIRAPARRIEVDRWNLGLYLDRPPTQIPDRALQSGKNFRVKNGMVRNENMGWETFPAGGTAINLDGEQVLLIDSLFLRSGTQYLIFGNRYDLFRYDEVAGDLKYITPIYDDGQVTAAVYAAGPDETTITGSGTLWNTDPGDRNGLNNVEVGDQFHGWDGDYHTQAAADWARVKAVNSDTEIVVEGDVTAGFSNPSDYTIRQLFVGDNLDLWKAEVFPAFDTGAGLEDRWYATNGVDYVVRWRGPTIDPRGATRVDLGFSCKTLRRFKNMMLYANLVETSEEKPTAIRNSDVAFPEDVTNGLAAEIVPSEGIDPILELMQIGDVVVVYNERGINTLQFVGLPFVFVSRTAVPGIGPIASGAIADFGDFHEFIGADSGYRFNGVGIEPFGDQVLREALRAISPQRIPKTITHVDEENGETHWIIPSTTDETGDEGGPKDAYTSHYLEDVGNAPMPFSFRDLPATATGYYERQSQLTFDQVMTQWINTNFRWNDRFFEAAFPFNLFGDGNGYVFILGTTDSGHDGTQALDIASFVRGKRWPAIDGRRVGMVKRIEPFAKTRAGATAYGLVCSVYGADRKDGEASIQDAGVYNLTAAGERFVPVRGAGRYVELEFSFTGQQAPWEMSGFALEIVGMGTR